MKNVVLDASSLISLSDTCLFGLLESISAEINVKFVIPKSVEEEAVERPLHIKRFELNALRIKYGIDSGFLNVHEPKNGFLKKAMWLDSLVNSIYHFQGKNIAIMHRGEIESLILLKELDSKTLIIDERTTRLLIEDPKDLREMLQRRQRRKIDYRPEKINELKEFIPNVTVARSSELIAFAYEKGLLTQGISQSIEALEASLYAVKFNGCAISNLEIMKYLREVKINANQTS